MSGQETQRCLAAMAALRAQYLDTVQELERSRKPGDGLFGMKGGPADDPCHDRYAAELGALLAGFAAAKPESGDVCRVLAELCDVPERKRVPQSAYWMLIAVQSFGLDLVPLLNREDAGALRQSFARDYPRWSRLPAQEKLLSALKNAEKGL